MDCDDGRSIHHWDLCSVLNPQPQQSNHVCVFLNCRVVAQQKYFHHLWNSAGYRVVVDGGANCLSELMQSLPDLKAPNLLTGDFDSIRPDVYENFAGRKDVAVAHTPDQDSTDFTKCLYELAGRVSNPEPVNVIVWADSVGRLDQILANIHTLCLVQSDRALSSRFSVFCLASDSVSWLLPRGSNRVYVEAADEDCSTRWCALVPLCRVHSVTTSGLRWNLHAQTLSFGGLISTSNQILARSAHIQCSEAILFIVEI